MKYFRVKPEYDNKSICYCYRGYYKNLTYLVGRELYTAKEWAKIVKQHVFGFNPSDAVDEVEIPKNKIYWCFGARFEKGTKF